MFAIEKSISKKWLLPLILASVMLLSACGGQAPSSEVSEDTTGGTGGETGSGGETAATDAPSSAVLGACANQYYPVVNGATHSYAVTGGVQDFSYTETISSLDADGFTVNTSYDLEGGLQTTQQWACQSDGIAALDYNSGPAAALSTQGVSAQYTTTDVTGVTIPANLVVGSAWEQSLMIEGDMTMAEGMSAHATGDVTYSANAVGIESVTTAAGTFDTIKVEIAQDFNITADVSGLSVPVAFTGTTTTWYAAGVGMVKATVSEDLMGTTSTIELQSYTIP